MLLPWSPPPPMLLSLLSPPLPLPPLLPPLSLELGDSGPAAAASSAGQGGWNLSLEEEAGSLFLAGMTFVSLSLSSSLPLRPHALCECCSQVHAPWISSGLDGRDVMSPTANV